MPTHDIHLGRWQNSRASGAFGMGDEFKCMKKNIEKRVWVYMWNDGDMTIHKADLLNSAYYDKHYLAQVSIFQSRHSRERKTGFLKN